VLAAKAASGLLRAAWAGCGELGECDV